LKLIGLNARQISSQKYKSQYEKKKKSFQNGMEDGALEMELHAGTQNTFCTKSCTMKILLTPNKKKNLFGG